MQILFITSSVEDYLADGILHGLKSLFGQEVVDYPKCERLYKSYPAQVRSKLYGRGFTLYSGLLDDLPVDRANVIEKVQRDFYELVIVGDIWRQFGWFVQFLPWLRPERTIILDGADSPQVYPCAGFWWRRPYYWFLPRAHTRFLYFKREWTEDSHFRLSVRLLPRWARNWVKQSRNLRRISFCIPEEKIISTLPAKVKDFPTHIVDPEVATAVSGSKSSASFEFESQYYSDLQASRFGITRKRSGWDCLRHYEIAMNGAVPCFRDLNAKPPSCAPHGLTIENCIGYRDWDELKQKISRLNDSTYQSLQAGAVAWAKCHSTVSVARRILSEVMPR